MLKSGTYFQLAPVLFGSGTAEKAGEKAGELGIKKAMLISDQGVRETGITERIDAVLKNAGIKTVVWAEAETDCPDYTVSEAAKIAKAECADGVIGVGGGSVLDTAKAVAAVAANDETVLDEIPLYLTGQKQYENPPLPLLEIPTTAGTGSESTFVSVVTSSKLDCKIGLPVHPDYGIVDPQLTKTVPADITAFTGMDTLAHAVEALVEKKATPHSDLLAYEAIRLVREYLPRAVKNGEDEEAREYLAFASNLAGISFNESGTNIGHSAAHAIGHAYHVPHGICCSNMTPAVIRFAAKTYLEKMKKTALLFDADISSEDPSEIGEAAAEAVRKFAASLGVKTFRDLGISLTQLLSLKNIINEDALCHVFGGTVTETDIEKLLTDADRDGRQ